jgi:hypothetical protein
MTDAPAEPIPLWWGGTNTPPIAIDPCTLQPVPPPENDCCVARLLFPFPVAASQWEIDHNLGRVPASVEIISSFGIVTGSRISHPTTNRTVIAHTEPFVGYALLLV